MNPTLVKISKDLRAKLAAATAGLQGLTEAGRTEHFKANRASTWGDPALVAALKEVAGNKCWYSEIGLGGADPNVDHFRPKGRIVEVDDEMEKIGQKSDGYWWLAFEPLNFRLSSQHANQRRVDTTTDGGKADFFPVHGARAPACTPYAQIFEDVVPLDPCSASDITLLWFDPDGKPVYLPKKNKESKADELRVKATIWLYHLDKQDTATPRRKEVENVQLKLKQADTYHQLWKGAVPCLKSKASFDKEVAEIALMIGDKSEFSRAKKCAVRLAVSEYEWIDDCQALLI